MQDHSNLKSTHEITNLNGVEVKLGTYALRARVQTLLEVFVGFCDVAMRPV